MKNYHEFLGRKDYTFKHKGLAEVPKLNPDMFEFQRAIVGWALRKGRAAIFADCGMGKTFMQLEWADKVPGKVLILAPLAVAEQTVSEGARFGIEVNYSRDGQALGKITITNYEMLDKFNPADFNAIVLDESSILKSYTGKFRTEIIEKFAATQFKLACTATPAPNDFIEIGNHAQFLGVMTREEMLAMYFVHDGAETQKWRVKGHAEGEFWKWICSWAVNIAKPSDIGFSDKGFNLPELSIAEFSVKAEKVLEGYLFPVMAATLQERIKSRRETTDVRAAKAAELVKIKPDDQWIVWCNLNTESAAIAAAIPGAVEISGSDKNEVKVQRMQDFVAGKIRVLVSKPSICGFGMNFQNCSNVIFCGLSDSYEQFYQAVRRCWRFGQKKPVDVYVIIADTEGAILKNIKRKEADAKRMTTEMVKNMSEITKNELTLTESKKSDYKQKRESGDGWTAMLGDCIEGVAALEPESIHYSIFSPPFASLYTYTDSDRDLGNCKDHDTFAEHFKFLVKDLFRVLKPGRLVSFHCMNLPTSKTRDGVIGLTDFRGLLIKMFSDEGFIFHSEVCIWKDPVTAMQRTKALGLLHKQLKKDACMSRQGIADYLVTMRKPGDNPERVTNTNESFPVQIWQNYASPVWMDINPSNTLQFRTAREDKDERHICPLQLEVIERGIRLWTNPGDLVLSPFMGIGSEGYVALKMNRKFIGFELKESYWKVATKNLREAISERGGLFSEKRADVAGGGELEISMEVA